MPRSKTGGVIQKNRNEIFFYTHPVQYAMQLFLCRSSTLLINTGRQREGLREEVDFKYTVYCLLLINRD